jgi:hypothetical protein
LSGADTVHGQHDPHDDEQAGQHHIAALDLTVSHDNPKYEEDDSDGDWHGGSRTGDFAWQPP